MDDTSDNKEGSSPSRKQDRSSTLDGVGVLTGSAAGFISKRTGDNKEGSSPPRKQDSSSILVSVGVLEAADKPTLDLNGGKCTCSVGFISKHTGRVFIALKDLGKGLITWSEMTGKDDEVIGFVTAK